MRRTSTTSTRTNQPSSLRSNPEIDSASTPEISVNCSTAERANCAGDGRLARRCAVDRVELPAGLLAARSLDPVERALRLRGCVISSPAVFADAMERQSDESFAGLFCRTVAGLFAALCASVKDRFKVVCVHL